MKDLLKPSEGMVAIQSLLSDRTHMYAHEIAKVTGFSVGNVFLLIRKLRIRGVGIMTTNKGYILANKASKADDVNFLRRLYGRRTSDLLALKSCHGAVQRRWSTANDKKQLTLMVTPLSANPRQYQGLSTGMTAVLGLDKQIKKGMSV